jgi:hypothetical protein
MKYLLELVGLVAADTPSAPDPHLPRHPGRGFQKGETKLNTNDF